MSIEQKIGLAVISVGVVLCLLWCLAQFMRMQARNVLAERDRFRAMTEEPTRAAWPCPRCRAEHERALNVIDGVAKLKRRKVVDGRARD